MTHSRLFRYRSSERCVQLENFLTEALVGLLDHLQLENPALGVPVRK